MNYPARVLFLIKSSTWNSFFGITLIAGAFLLFGCKKEDPKPELRDLIYQDMLAQQSEAERILKDTEAKIVDIRKNTASERPGTGLRKKADRQVHEMEKLLQKMNQQITYWKIRSFERLKHVRTLASKASDLYKSDPKEWELYQSEKKLRVAKNAWDLKRRFKESGFEYSPVLMGEMPGEAPPKEKPASGGGGH